ncbi:MAG: tetratricopeptide repeat protein, partial [Bryobacteraceae bacterium]|nr:tetratricopeptide repeat protein [Bryobacteraceae bacterium]
LLAVSQVQQELSDLIGQDAHRRTERLILLQAAEENVARVAEIQPGVMEYASRLFNIRVLISVALEAGGQGDEAEAVLQQSIGDLERLVKQSANDVQPQDWLGFTHQRLGDLYYKMGRFESAGQEYERALEIYRPIITKADRTQDRSMRIALTTINKIRASVELGGAAPSDEALQSLLAFAEDFPKLPTLARDHAQPLYDALTSLGTAIEKDGRPQEAVKALSTAISFAEQLVNRFPDDLSVRDELSRSHHAYGDFLFRTGHLDEASCHYGEAAELLASLGKSGYTIAGQGQALISSYATLASIYDRQGHPQQANAAREAALRILDLSINPIKNPWQLGNLIGAVSTLPVLPAITSKYGTCLGTVRDQISFEFADGTDGWLPYLAVSDVNLQEGCLTGRVIGGDPAIARLLLNIPGDTCSSILVRMRVTAGQEAQFYWASMASPGFDEGKVVVFPIQCDGQFHDYQLTVGEHGQWKGQQITAIRLDPTNGAVPAEFAIEYIRAEVPESK